MKEVSVVIPVYNGSETLRRAVESVVMQTIRCLEIIVVDDNSKDDTRIILSELVKEFTEMSFTILTNKENFGVGYSRNLGLKYARAIYVAFLDADDYWLPSKLEDDMEYLNQTDLVFSSYSTISGKVIDVVPGYYSLKNMLERNWIPCSTVVLKKSVFHGFPDERRRQDWMAWILFAMNNNSIYGHSKVNMVYDDSIQGLSSKKLVLLRDTFKVYNKYASFSKLKSSLYLGKFLINQLLHLRKIKL
jgi:teichuronic acid biosynthesis glycosyltransferase TuaG